MDSGESRFWSANMLNEMLYSKPSEEILAKIECRIDNHQLHDAAHSIRPIQDKSQGIETDLFGILNRKELYDIDWMDKTNQIAKTFSQKLVLCLRKYSDHLKQNNCSINRKNYSNKKNK